MLAGPVKLQVSFLSPSRSRLSDHLSGETIVDFKSRDKLNAKQKIFLLEVLFCYRGRAESSEKIRTQLNSDDRTHLFIYNYVYFYDKDLDIHPVELTEKAWNFIEKNDDHGRVAGFAYRTSI